MSDWNARAKALEEERLRIESQNEGLWRYVNLFDPTHSLEHCREYFAPNADKSEPSLFDCYESMFRPDNRLFLAINVFEQFPNKMRGDLDLQWDNYEFERLGSEFQGVEDLYRLAFKNVSSYLVFEAERNGINADDISLLGTITWSLIGTREARRNLWGDRYTVARWPESGLETGKIDARYRRDLEVGAARIKRLSSLVDRWRQPVIVRFRESGLSVEDSPVLPGTVMELPGPNTRPYIESGAVEMASQAELDRYERLMREVSENEKVTASDELSRKLILDDYNREVANKQKREEEREKNKRRFWVVEEEIPPPDSPKLIVRFLRLGTAGSCSFSVGAVYPIEKERAVRLLLEREPVVELATPEELKRDREHFSHMEAVFKDWEQKRIPADERLVEVRILRQVRHPEKKQVVCEPGEKWKFGFDDAYRLARGRIPDAEILTKVRKKAARSGPAKDVGSGDAQSLIKSTFLHYHRYGTDKLRTEPIGSNQLALQASVSKGTASGFFGEYFGNYRAYKLACKSNEALLRKLQKINDDYVSPKSRLLGDLKSQSVEDDDE